MATIGGIIKSIQRGTISISGATSNTATISSVDTTKSVLRHLGQSTSSSSYTDRALARIYLTNGTTITADRGSSTNSTTVSYEVVEYA